MSLKKYKIIIIFVIVIILIFLNIKKYREINDNTAVPVWSSYDDQYYESRPETGFLDKLANTFNPDRLVYGMTKVRLRAPITYLKREIPLLAYYTPEELKKPTETIYQPGSRKNNMIELKFDLREDNKENETQTKITDNSKSEDNKIKDPTDKQNNNQLPDRPENRADENERIPINGEKPVIAIYHTHNSETYIDDPRHQDDNGHVLPGNIGNVGKVGMEVARILSEEYKFRVIHTTKIHDTKYSMSYYNSRKTVKELLSNYPEIDLLLDIHRDGIKANVSKDDITAVLNRQRIANVMVVVGNGKYKINTTNDLENRYSWRENLNLANQFANTMDELYPGVMRRVEIRDTTSNRYNQDLSPRSILIEMGDYRNTTQEAMRAARCVADAIAEMF